MKADRVAETGAKSAGLFARIPVVSRSRPIAAPEYLRVMNVDRQAEIGNHIEVADTAARRNKGLLGRSGLMPGEGLWIVPCEAVHTFAMKFAIDLVYLDRRRRVVKVRGRVGPARLSACLRAHSILELPPGVIAATQTQPGDRLEFHSAPASAQSGGDTQ
ncbi:MAG TPA: DUF192 domain-containing protein [Terracidiphilus sp.]|jgi:hypothetical protein|nr:DUF192 domain-containing protein [Terracidiphilus sp.]